MTKGLFGIGLDMLFTDVYKIMVDEVTFAGFRGRAITFCNQDL